MKLKTLCATVAIPMALLTGCWSEPTPPPPGSYGYNACGEPYTDNSVLNELKDTTCKLKQQNSRQPQPPVGNSPVQPTAPSNSGSTTDRYPCGITDMDSDGIGDRCDYTDDRDDDGDGWNNSSDPYPNDYDNDSTSDGRDTTIGKDSDYDGTPDAYDSYPYDSDRD